MAKKKTVHKKVVEMPLELHTHAQIPRRIRAGEKNLSPEEIAEKRILEWSVSRSLRKGREHWKRFGQKTEILELGGLGLQSFPESIRKLTNIENIDFGGNKIEKLPKWIGELKRLIGINLRFNRLRLLPKEIAQLNNLQVIHLNGNNLQALPKAFQKLPIKEIRLEGNPDLGLPQSILDRPAQEIFPLLF